MYYDQNLREWIVVGILGFFLGIASRYENVVGLGR